MRTLQERLKLVMAGPPKISQAALARACGVRPPSVNDWISGKTKSIEGENLLLAAQFLRVHPLWLATGKGPMRGGDENGAQATDKESNVQAVDFSPKRARRGEIVITQYDVTASMGSGQVAPDSYIETIKNITVREDYLREQGVFYTRAENLAVVTGFGESMDKTFHSGDPLIIDRGVNDVVVDGVYLFTLDGMLYIKRLQRLPKMIKMISDNEAFQPYDIRGEELDSMIIHARVLLAWNAKKL